MKKMTIQISEANKIEGLTIQQLEALQTILKSTLSHMKRVEAKNKKAGLILFPSEVETIAAFRLSKCFDFSIFEESLKKEKELNVDILYYYEAVKNWSDINPKTQRTNRGWVATARTFMQGDAAKQKLRMTVSSPTIAKENDDMISYLNTVNGH